jgi:hypothetical protein
VDYIFAASPVLTSLEAVLIVVMLARSLSPGQVRSASVIVDLAVVLFAVTLR